MDNQGEILEAFKENFYKHVKIANLSSMTTTVPNINPNRFMSSFLNQVHYPIQKQQIK